MAVFKPELFDIQSVLNYYDQVKSPYYAIYAGPQPHVNSLRFEYLEDDAAVGRELLEDNLMAIEQNRSNTNTYVLQIMATRPKSGTVTTKKKGAAWPSSNKNITFQLNRDERLTAVGGYNTPPTDPGIVRLLQKMDDRMLAIEQKLDEQEAGSKINGNDNSLGAIGAILENPALQPIIGALAGKLVDWLERPPAPPLPQPAPGVHGIPGYPYITGETQEMAIQVTELLLEEGLTIKDLEKLLLLKTKKPMQFGIYISMLRTMKI